MTNDRQTFSGAFPTPGRTAAAKSALPGPRRQHRPSPPPSRSPASSKPLEQPTTAVRGASIPGSQIERAPATPPSPPPEPSARPRPAAPAKPARAATRRQVRRRSPAQARPPAAQRKPARSQRREPGRTSARGALTCLEPPSRPPPNWRRSGCPSARGRSVGPCPGFPARSVLGADVRLRAEFRILPRHFRAERSPVRSRSAGEPLVDHLIHRGESVQLRTVALS